MTGPHQGEQPPDERGLAYITDFVGEYTHVTYPMRRVTGWEEVLLEQRRSELMARHFRASFK